MTALAPERPDVTATQDRWWWLRHVDHTGSWTSIAGITAAGVVGATAVMVRNPHVPGALGMCPVYWATGLYCPGCGALRATRDFLTGHWQAALSENLLLAPAMIWVAWWLAASVARQLGVPATRFRSAPSSVGFIIGLSVVVVAFAVARNLPGSPLAP
jgi:hypothetical protein